MTDYKIESLLLDKRACIAAMEHDTAKYGEWRSDYQSHLYAINAEIGTLLSSSLVNRDRLDFVSAPRDGYAVDRSEAILDQSYHAPPLAEWVVNFEAVDLAWADAVFKSPPK